MRPRRRNESQPDVALARLKIPYDPPQSARNEIHGLWYRNLTSPKCFPASLVCGPLSMIVAEPARHTEYIVSKGILENGISQYEDTDDVL